MCIFFDACLCTCGYLFWLSGVAAVVRVHVLRVVQTALSTGLHELVVNLGDKLEREHHLLFAEHDTFAAVAFSSFIIGMASFVGPRFSALLL